MRRSVRALVTVVVTIATVAIGCGDSDDDNGGGPYVPPSPITTGGTDGQSRPTPTDPPIDAGCTAAFPMRLAVTTRIAGELPYLRQIAACTRAAQDATLLVNDSEATWTIGSNPGGASVAQLTNDLKAVSYRNAILTVYTGAVLAPETTVRIDARPSAVEWTLSPELTATWLIHEQFAEAFKSYSQTQLAELLTTGASPRRQAMVTCSIAAYNVAGDAAQALNGRSPMSQLLTGIGVGTSSTKCALAWRQADADALQRFSTTARWDDDIARLGRNTKLLEDSDTLLSAVRRIGKAALLLATR